MSVTKPFNSNSRLTNKDKKIMNTLKHILTYLMVCVLVIIFGPLGGIAQQGSDVVKTSQQVVIERNGQHDFDFNFGIWKTHISRLRNPLTGSTAWAEYDGISVVRKVWDGRASLFELEADGTAGHIEGVGLRLFNPQSHQWSLNWANSSMGTLGQPMIGEFKDGRGEFFDQEPFSGRTIFVRNGFSNITRDSSRFEQAFSDDGGKTWETNWIMTFIRMKD
jgi:hypothetical protein